MTTEPEAGSRQNDMNLIGHLAELRLRLIKGLVFICVGCLLCWNFAGTIMAVLLRPALKALPSGQGLVYTGLQDGFLITFKTSLWAGFLVSSPLWLYQLWAFIAPAMTRNEKKSANSMAALGALLLLAGASFSYYLVLPLVFDFFLTFSSDHLQPLLAIDRYYSLTLSMVLAFALSFQLPLFLMFLGHLGLIGPDTLRRNRRYAILAAFIIGAFLTPPDVVSQVILAAALLALYELSIILMRPARDGSGNEDEGA